RVLGGEERVIGAVHAVRLGTSGEQELVRRKAGPLICLKHVVRVAVLLGDVPVGLNSRIADVGVLGAISCILTVVRTEVRWIFRRAFMAITHNCGAGSIHLARVIRGQPADVMVVVWVGAVRKWSGV